MALARVARSAYRALARVSRALERERVRMRAKTALELLTERELSTLETALGARAMRRARALGAARTLDIARDAFRRGADAERSARDRVDAALSALATLRRRARWLAATPRRATSERATAGVRVKVRARLRPDQTAPAIGRYAYAYEVTIANEGNDEAVQVVSREWRVRDESGFEETISGRGVVGEQPTLARGEKFSYTSACVLKRARGSMSGKYTCVFQESRRIVDVVVAPFALTPRERDDDDVGDDDDDEASSTRKNGSSAVEAID